MLDAAPPRATPLDMTLPFLTVWVDATDAPVVLHRWIASWRSVTADLSLVRRTVTPHDVAVARRVGARVVDAAGGVPARAPLAGPGALRGPTAPPQEASPVEGR